MRLIAHKLGDGGRNDRLRCVRADGTSCEVAMPRQRILPHDLIHAVVESRLAFDNGFIGLVAKGADIDFATQEFHRFIDPQRHAQVAQSESLVESLQTQLWAGTFDDAAFRYGLETTCAMRGVAMPDLSGIDAKAELFDVVARLGDEWSRVPANGSWELEFPLAASRS